MRTSSIGRSQFCDENAYSVSAWMPISRQARVTSRTESAPLRWPSIRGRPRRLAQRPLPSMMMATCRGRSSASDEGKDIFGLTYHKRELSGYQLYDEKRESANGAH